MNILCELTLSCYPTNRLCNSGEERIQQYINGLNNFFELNKDNEFDILITDNTISDKLPQEILNVIPDRCNIITCMNNNYGCINKGAGIIEQWNYNKELLEKYQWLIHFERRQLLQNYNFINSFLENPRNLFNKSNTIDGFNTGLFCIEIKTLMDYMNQVTPKSLVVIYESIKKSLYNYFINKDIKFDTIDKMGLIWYNDMNIYNKTQLM